MGAVLGNRDSVLEHNNKGKRCLQFHGTPCNSETGVEHIRDPEHVNRLIQSNDVEIQKFGFSGIWEVHGVHHET